MLANTPLIVMALEQESQGMLEALGYEVLYCGVGKINAAYTLTRHLQSHHYDYVLNLGSAGSRSFPHDTLVEASGFVQRDMDATALGCLHGQTPFDASPILLESTLRFSYLPAGICASGDSFVNSPPPITCDMVDMEAYALAKVCLLEDISFACVKYITDGADGTAGNDWQENLHRAAHAFAKLLREAA